MIYEMRTYMVKMGSVRAAEAAFERALPGRIKLSPLAAFWHSEIGQLNQIIHVWPYESQAHREQIRAAAGKVEGWPPALQEFLVEQKTEIFMPAPFSPPLVPAQLGSLVEMRRYTIRPGGIPTLIKNWSERIEKRAKLSPFIAGWYSEVGPLNQWLHIWAYQDYAERERIRAEAMKDGSWPPPMGDLLVKAENSILIPASFSPIR
ncbi:MAG TPA: NIPSNAP family protein [Candidatus Binataceae bacterium]|nr:NIPSNAP family protein [Candidatus Binataceae bacterium]